jgi:hypothetical protein
MTAHPLDSENSSLPEVAEDATLWRRILPTKTVYDDNQKRRRPSSDSFKDNINGTPMSVFDASRCSGIEQVLKGNEHCLIASITARQARERGMEIVRSEKEGIGHCEVVGHKTKSVRSDWAKESLWVLGPIED